MRLSNERARAIAEAAILFEAAKDKARQALADSESHRRWNGTGYVYLTSEEAWRRSSGVLAFARADRDSKRRSYQRQIKSALLESVS